MNNDDQSYTADNNFTEVMRSPSQSNTQFQTKICQETFEWWDTFKPNIPTRSQFDIIDHVKKAPNIFLIKVLGDGRYEYRLHGEEVIKIVGRRTAGVNFSSQSEDEDLGRFALYLNELCATKVAMHSYGTLEAHGKSFLNFESFDFPLSNEQGEISHIVGVITLVKLARQEKTNELSGTNTN